MARWPASARIFLKADGEVLGPGDRLVQNDLADTLETIARDGAQAFYRGPVAEKIASAIQAAGGVMTAADLTAYRAVERAPVHGTYRGFTVVSMPPPSSGGVHLVEMLNILEGYPSDVLKGPDGPHLLAEVMKRAYADRAVFLGDPDRVVVPVAGLTSKRYADALRAEIDMAHARPARDIRPGVPAPTEGNNTTHFSIIDGEGNAVANTYTLNYGYGLGFVAEGTGVLLNNELDDFSMKPFAPNGFGLVGFEANAPDPGKRPLSSMTPTILLKDGKPAMVTGSPGGSRIITTVLQVIVNVIDRGMSLADAVAAPRLHHQWLPDHVVVEDGYSADGIAELKRRGHDVVIRSGPTSANSIEAVPGGLIGAADTRTRGALAVGN
jgi:gamma-glutamyltranspeptidase/glutathione hydrolase